MPTGTLTYTDASLSAGAVRYYQVRATVSSGVTPFSNTAAASTVAYVINLNMNDGSPNAPAQLGNWNNTNTIMAEGFVLPNMLNDQGQATGINFNLVKEFSGFNIYGTTTGNNTGVYPDNVMKSFYYLNYADTAKIMISGLTLTHKYSFVFFGSRVNPQTGVSTGYKIGNKSVALDAGNNTSNTVKIEGVVPDANGNVLISVYGLTNFGYLNAMAIEGAPNLNATAPVVTETVTTNTASITALNIAPEANHDALVLSSVSGYPNPFTSEINIRFSLNKPAPAMVVTVCDLFGRIIVKQDLKQLSTGTQQVKLNIPSNIKSGLYIIRINDGDGKTMETLKMIKR
ncbi:T9SS type A sorting domain-containing protein [Parasegetibacter sp. NRK P23]|uniref:T9SS type A sorting domain-containing protein n=1 Tax=Parasegetibacter sp. NRK P23 TaxID=2942999 RepID=UPI002043F207|nr:T9SS type A sorting domain-containing protein [Parasegetibacter sp. NRK P23]MCM5527004.1 T9SS type A sorting domain-containing protein [Parasegetibacter sp. NRK P23]